MIVVVCVDLFYTMKVVYRLLGIALLRFYQVLFDFIISTAINIFLVNIIAVYKSAMVGIELDF